MKFNLHGHSSPDWKRPPPPKFVPSPVRSGSARITLQLHAHTYTSSVKLHYNTIKTQTTTITIHITTFGMFREGEGGGGAATNIKVCGPLHKRLWNKNGCVVIFLPLSPYLIHPTLVLQFPPSPTARTSRTRSRRSHFLFFITGTCCLFVFHHWKTQVRYPLLHHWKTLLLSPHLRNRVGDCIHIWS